MNLPETTNIEWASRERTRTVYNISSVEKNNSKLHDNTRLQFLTLSIIPTELMGTFVSLLSIDRLFFQLFLLNFCFVFSINFLKS